MTIFKRIFNLCILVAVILLLFFNFSNETNKYIENLDTYKVLIKNNLTNEENVSKIIEIASENNVEIIYKNTKNKITNIFITKNNKLVPNIELNSEKCASNIKEECDFDLKIPSLFENIKLYDFVNVNNFSLDNALININDADRIQDKLK